MIKRNIIKQCVILLICIILVGCSKTATPTVPTGKPVSNNPTSSDIGNQGEASSSNNNDISFAGGNKKDIPDFIDLTTVNSTMLAVEVHNIVTNPEDYIGKTIKIMGPYCNEYFADTDKYYHYVLYDYCCQVVEFEWNGDHKCPDDYPVQLTEIEIVGKFDTYRELGQQYCCIYADDIKIVT